MEWWSDGFEPHSNTPLLQHSISFMRLASESFLNSLNMSFSTLWLTF